MINKLIYKHHPTNYWLLAILIFISNFIFFFHNNNDGTIIIKLFNGLIYKLNILPNINLIIKILIILLSSFLIIHISKTYQELISITLPSLIFIIFLTTIPITQLNTIFLLFVSFIIFLLNTFFKIYEEKFIYKFLFNFGFILGFLSIINFFFLLLMPILYLWLIHFRQFNIKEYLLPVVSFVVPYFIVDAMYFIITNNENYTIFNANQFFLTYDKSFRPYFSIFILMLLLIFSFYKITYATNILKKIRHRKYFYWMFFSTLYLWIVFFISFNQIIFITIIIFMSLITSIIVISFNKPLYSKLFIIFLFLINIISILTNI